MNDEQISYTREISNLRTPINAESAELMMELFNRMPIDALQKVPESIAKRIGDFMVANGYRIVFDRWYLQADPQSIPETSTRHKPKVLRLTPTPEQCAIVRASAIYEAGDTVVIAIGEGDCLMYCEEIQQPFVQETSTNSELHSHLELGQIELTPNERAELVRLLRQRYADIGDTLARKVAEMIEGVAPKTSAVSNEQTFIAAAVSALRKHRWCGDQYPENGWPDINAALALYAKLGKSVKTPDTLDARRR